MHEKNIGLQYIQSRISQYCLCSMILIFRGMIVNRMNKNEIGNTWNNIHINTEISRKIFLLVGINTMAQIHSFKKNEKN